MQANTHLQYRKRGASASELASIPWLKLLSPAEYERAAEELRVSDALAGEYVCRVGKPITYWFGVIDGLLKMSSDNVDGVSMTVLGVPPGGWFGEGTALKREPYRYNIQALRKSVVAGLPIDTFHWLLDHSIGSFACPPLSADVLARADSQRVAAGYGRSGRKLLLQIKPRHSRRCGEHLHNTSPHARRRGRAAEARVARSGSAARAARR